MEIDFEKKTATVMTKEGKTVSRERVALAFQESKKYGITEFTEKPVPDPERR